MQTAPKTAPIVKSRIRVAGPVNVPLDKSSQVKSSQVKSSQVKFGPLLLTYLFSEGTYVSIYDVSPHYGSPSAISIDSRPPLLALPKHIR